MRPIDLTLSEDGRLYPTIESEWRIRNFEKPMDDFK